MAGTAIFTDFGQQQTIDLIDPATRGATTTDFTIAWGAGNSTPAVTQTALDAENPEPRVIATITQPLPDTVRFVGTITATDLRVVQEAAVFSAPGAAMWLRGTHALLNIEAGDRVEYTFDLQQKDVSEP